MKNATVLSVGDLILDVPEVERYFDESRELLRRGDIMIMKLSAVKRYPGIAAPFVYLPSVIRYIPAPRAIPQITSCVCCIHHNLYKALP